MDNRTKSDNFCTELFYKYLKWSAPILIAVMTVATFVFIGKGCSSEKFSTKLDSDSINVGVMQVVTFTPKANEKYIYDSTSFIHTKAFKAHVDSLNTLLFSNQKDLRERQTELIADIRQETNNNIDKMSAWLAFWITVLGFVGIACPVAYQWMNYGNMKVELDKLGNKIREAEDRLNTVNEAYNVKMNVVAFTQLCDSRLDELDTVTLRSIYIGSVKSHYQRFIESIYSTPPKLKVEWNDLKIHICSILINLNTFLSKFRLRSGFDESKKIRDVLDLLPDIIKKVAKADSKDLIKDDLLKIQTKLIEL